MCYPEFEQDEQDLGEEAPAEWSAGQLMLTLCLNLLGWACGSTAVWCVPPTRCSRDGIVVQDVGGGLATGLFLNYVLRGGALLPQRNMGLGRPGEPV